MAHLNVAVSHVVGSGRTLIVLDQSHVSNPRGIITILPRNSNNSSIPAIHKLICDIIDSLGVASARAQGLPMPITSANKLASSPDQRIYLLIDTDSDRVVGLLKVGRKRLFLADPRRHDSFDQALVECQPMCILDFYVVESHQRHGCGRRLAEAMLSSERIPISFMAVDRPSPKMISFLSRHYGLTKPFTQRNNFMVFESFFNPNNPALSRAPSAYRRNPGVQGAIRKSFSSSDISDKFGRSISVNPVDGGKPSWASPADATLSAVPRTLPPIPPGEGRQRFAQPMSADVLIKSRQMQPAAMPDRRMQGVPAEPPLLTRETGLPDAYRKLFSAKDPPFPKLFDRNNNSTVTRPPTYGFYQAESRQLYGDTSPFNGYVLSGRNQPDDRASGILRQATEQQPKNNALTRNDYAGNNPQLNKVQRPPFYRPF